MKYFLCWCFIPLIVLNALISADHPPKLHKRFTRTEDTSTNLGLGSEDREELQEALQLLNMGKQSLNLPTEDTQLLIQLVDASNATDRSDQIQKFVQEPFDDPSSKNEQQYMALSGEEGHVNVNNYSVVTPAPGEVSTNQNGGDVQDFFKMVVRKKVPGAKDNAMHKITIIETNQIKPFSGLESLQSRRKKRVWSHGNSYNAPLARQKRTKEDPLQRFLRDEFSKNDDNYLFTDKVSPVVHTVKIRDLFNGNEFEDKNKHWDRSKFGYNDFDGQLKSQFQEPYSPSIRPIRGWEPSQKSHKRREVFQADMYRKQRVPLSSPKAWWDPPKYKPWMGGGNEFISEDVENIDNIFKNGVHKSHIPSVSATKAQIHPRTKSIGTSFFKRSNFHDGGSMANSKPNVFSQSPMTTSTITPKNEKTDHILDVPNVYNVDIINIPQEENVTGTTPTNILEATTLVFIGLLCFSIITLACSSVVGRNSQKKNNTLELKDAHVTLNVISDDGFSSNLRQGQLHYKTRSGTSYRKLVDEFGEEEADDFLELEWQSEMGEWLSDQGSVRNAIVFEKL